jgi:hypothetical protein
MITNRQVIDSKNILFAHTDGYFFPDTFANRIKSREFLANRLRCGEPSITVISDILGSGKSFLLQMAQSELGLNSVKTLRCGEDDDAEALNTNDPVFIDEIDIKARPRRIKSTIDAIRNKMRTHPSPLVLVGDYTLKNPDFESMLKEVCDVGYVPMEPLNPVFFDQAMQQRLGRVAKNLAVDVVGTEILESDLKSALVPNWTVMTSANFRDTYCALYEMARYLKNTTEMGQITRLEAIQWVEKCSPNWANELQANFYQSYLEFLARLIAEGGWESVYPMREEELRRLPGIGDVTKERFRLDIIEPMCKKFLVLSAMGDPSIDFGGTVYHRYPEPYLPGTLTRITAAFGGKRL